MINKRLVLAAFLGTVLFVGGYLAWTTWISPRPAAVAQEASAVGQPDSAITPNPTIVPASLNKDGVPNQLGTLRLVKSTVGKDALKEFESLHGKAFDLLGGFKAEYESSDARATLWVGQAKDAASAQALVKEMSDKIGTGDPMFTDLNELSIQDRTIYQVSGQGQAHFFYSGNDKVIWLAADPAYAPDALHSIWSAIK